MHPPRQSSSWGSMCVCVGGGSSLGKDAGNRSQRNFPKRGVYQKSLCISWLWKKLKAENQAEGFQKTRAIAQRLAWNQGTEAGLTLEGRWAAPYWFMQGCAFQVGKFCMFSGLPSDQWCVQETSGLVQCFSFYHKLGKASYSWPQDMMRQCTRRVRADGGARKWVCKIFGCGRTMFQHWWCSAPYKTYVLLCSHFPNS